MSPSVVSLRVFFYLLFVALTVALSPFPCSSDAECTPSYCLDGTWHHNFCDKGYCIGDTMQCEDSISCTVNSCNDVKGCLPHDDSACGCSSDSQCFDFNNCTTDSCRYVISKSTRQLCSSINSNFSEIILAITGIASAYIHRWQAVAMRRLIAAPALLVKTPAVLPLKHQYLLHRRHLLGRDQ